VEGLTKVSQAEFFGFRVNFEPGRSPHDAVGTLGIEVRRTNIIDRSCVLGYTGSCC